MCHNNNQFDPTNLAVTLYPCVREVPDFNLG